MMCILVSIVGHGQAREALAMTELEDVALSEISAQSLAFNLVGVSLSGDIDFTYTGAGSQALTLGGLEFSRNDDSAATFSDPYTLELNPGSEGQPDSIRIAGPENASALLGWQFAADWAVFDGYSTFNGGAVVLDNLQSYGSSLSISPSLDGDGAGLRFGATLQSSLGALVFRPLGRTAGEGELRISGIHVSGYGGGPWVLSDLDNQVGRVSTVTDVDGDPVLELEIEWPKNKLAPAGTIYIENVDVYGLLAPGGLPGMLPVGARAAVSVRKFQIQYLNVRLHP